MAAPLTATEQECALLIVDEIAEFMFGTPAPEELKADLYFLRLLLKKGE